MRIDLFETLQSAHDAMVYDLPRLEMALDVSRRDGDDAIFVLSINDDRKNASLDEVLGKMERGKVVVIANSEPPAVRKYHSAVFVQRPFSSSVVLRSVNALIAARP